jgi:nitroimidazol reductase NimA-like FMN-containing flavoprotein (pyridoxamine 5'-phosphate oxidase superfamily)
MTQQSNDVDRLRVRRLPEKQVDDRAVLDAILDAGRVGHLAVVDENEQPYVLPVAYARDGDRLLVHGSTGSRLFRTLAAGAWTCLTVTHLDGLILARSAFESSMRYRSAMVLGTCDLVTGADKLPALEVLTDHLLPNRWDTLRAPLAKEVAATMILSLPIAEWSVKVNDGWPDDPAEDLDAPVWAGVLPMALEFRDPLPSPDLRGKPGVPDYLAGWRP